ncbi:TPA_asm: coat protein [ssRNA phage SRR6960509_11]|uniref:Coat protein n=1 Tax=ssRNA phage SRR6960509_11 TaxID=2786522 RepID=A0A8S5L5L5_9VIRU|nr:coat protein [ssRNA phage SRR6960509_11]DAD52578.1 TPA_asm: coat protein [ssRNA phage SRR6960509_11]
MSVITALTVAGLSQTDGTTVVNHTFVKEANVLNGIKLRDSAQSDFSLAPRLTFTAKQPTAQGKVIREKTVMTIPYKDVHTGLLAGTFTRTIEDIIPAAAPLNVRKDAAATVMNLAAAAVVKDIIINLDFAS